MKAMASGLLAVSTALTTALVLSLARADILGPPSAETVAQAASDETATESAAREPRKLRSTDLRRRKAKGDDRLLFAVVRFDGSLSRGFGVKSTLRTGLGSYRVFFNRDVTACSHVVSVSGPGTDDVHGVADAAQVMGKPKGLYVNTFDISVDTGTNQLARFDAPFHLQVMCPPAD